MLKFTWRRLLGSSVSEKEPNGHLKGYKVFSGKGECRVQLSAQLVANTLSSFSIMLYLEPDKAQKALTELARSNTGDSLSDDTFALLKQYLPEEVTLFQGGKVGIFTKQFLDGLFRNDGQKGLVFDAEFYSQQIRTIEATQKQIGILRHKRGFDSLS